MAMQAQRQQQHLEESMDEENMGPLMITKLEVLGSVNNRNMFFIALKLNIGQIMKL